MLRFLKQLAWYPPAETKIPWRAILSAFTEPSGDFKDDLCCFLKVNHCILGESARALLFKLLETLKIQHGNQRNEVLIPGYTCYSVAAAIAKAGLKITVYDLDPATLYPDVASIKSVISEKTLAVITQHLFGMMSPLDAIKKITYRYNTYLIEDAAQALGNSPDEKESGTKGDFGLFSFGRGKPLPIGCGGALVSQSHPHILLRIKLDRPKRKYLQAMVSAATQVVSNPTLYWIPEILPLGLGQTVFDLGFHVGAMPYVINKISQSALPHLNRLNFHRTRLAGVYRRYLANDYQIKNTEKASSMVRFPVILPDSKQLSKELNCLGVRKMYPKAILDENLIKPYLKNEQKPTPGSAEISRKLLTLPTHLGISERMAKQICFKVNQFALGR